MPSQITHQIFAKDVIDSAHLPNGALLYQSNNKIISFAAQGPDIFYHNRRSAPKSLAYGRRIHKKNFGRLIKNMVVASREASSQEREQLLAFILGYTTHAILDRISHPFIIYHAGWVVPFDIESERYYRMHPFLERIIDVLILEKKRGETVTNFDFDRTLNIEGLPSHIEDVLLTAIQKTYPDITKNPITAESLRNAVDDTLSFYNMTNPANRNVLQKAYLREKRKQSSYRVLALFHPHNIPPDIDFLNERRAEWIDPCEPTISHNDSFLDLYEEAVTEASRVLPLLYDVFQTGRGVEELEQQIGNTNLSDGRNTTGCKPQTSHPLPLPEVLQRVYDAVASELGETRLD